MPETLHSIPTNYASAANADLELYLLVSGDEAVMIDAGISTSPDAGVIDRARDILDGRRLSAILITHAHVDHVGGATALRRAFGARILVPRDDVGWIEDPVFQWHAFWDTVGDEFDIGQSRAQILEWSGPAFKVDGLIRPNDRIPVGTGFVRAVLTRAHTPGHTCYFDEDLGVVFTGDYVQFWGSPSADGATAFPPLYDSVTAYVTGLQALAALPFQRLATAHRGVLDRERGLAALADSEAFTHRVNELTVELAGVAPGVSVPKLAAAIAGMAGAREPLSVQSVITARAHIRHALNIGALAPAEHGVWRA